MATVAPPTTLPADSGAPRTGSSNRRHPTPPRGRALWRRYLNITINLTLLALVVMSFVTGWIASFLGLTEFGLHKYSSLALLLVASGHVVVHWRGLTTQLRHLGTNRYDRRTYVDRRVDGSRSDTL